jgi:hypothetical protein
VRRLREHPSAVLLVCQLGTVLLYPFLGASWQGRAALGVVGTVVVGLALAAVRRTPALTVIAVLLGVPAVALTVVEAFRPDDTLVVAVGAILHVAFYFYVSYGMIRYLFHDSEVTVDELYATGAAFTVVMWGFAHLFVFVEALWPGSFAPLEGQTPFFDALFLSFTTLTSVGLSDVLPASAQGRAALMLGEFAGVMYVALVVSRLVGLTIRRR